MSLLTQNSKTCCKIPPTEGVFFHGTQAASLQLAGAKSSRTTGHTQLYQIERPYSATIFGRVSFASRRGAELAEVGCIVRSIDEADASKEAVPLATIQASTSQNDGQIRLNAESDTRRQLLGQCMGVYYFYVNETKQEYFCIDPTGSDIKSYALGRNIGSRALAYLLLQNDADYTAVEPHPLVGSLIGDSFFVTGDDYCPTFETISTEYADIGQSIIEMIIDIAPYDLIEYGGAEWLIHLMQNNGEHVTISDKMRRRLLKFFRHENHLDPSEGLKSVISALRLND